MEELRAFCRPAGAGAGPSGAGVAAAASHFAGVFLVCAWCLELSRVLEDPRWIRRRGDRLLCAPQARPARARRRAAGARALLSCLSCVVMLCHRRHCRSSLQCRPLRGGAWGKPRAGAQIACTRALPARLLSLALPVLRRHALPSAPLPYDPKVPPIVG